MYYTRIKTKKQEEFVKKYKKLYNMRKIFVKVFFSGK